MKEFLEQTLRQQVQISERDFLNNKLPLVYRGKYFYYDVKSNGLSWIAIKPKSNISVDKLIKDRLKIEKTLNLNCAIFMDQATLYVRDVFIANGVPFVVLNKQIYLPFIGILLSDNNQRELKPVHLISFLTQKLILVAIYDKWECVNVSTAAIKLGVSKMAISKCFDEIEYLNIDIMFKKGQKRFLNIPKDTKLLWDNIKNLFRNPVLLKYEFAGDINLNNKAGISALSEYSLLSDNEYPTYAVTKKNLNDIKTHNIERKHQGQEAGSVVLELGYFIDFNGKGIQDPLSVYLSLTEEEKSDERVMISLNTMLEEYVW